jgi:hypothetical protein
MFRVSAPACPATAARRSPGNSERFASQNRLLQGAARARRRTAGRCPAHLQPAAKTVSNLSKMNTCANGVANSRRIRTYKIIELKASCNEHLQKKGVGGVSLLPSGPPTAFAPSFAQRQSVSCALPVTSALLVRSFARVQCSTPLISYACTLFSKNTQEGVAKKRGRIGPV